MRRSALLWTALVASFAALLAGGAFAGVHKPGVNDKPYVYVSIADVSAVEGTTAAMTITSSRIMPFPIEVYWKTANGTGSESIDYPAQTGKAVIPAGKTSTTCLVSSKADSMYEPNRTFRVQLWSDDSVVRLARSEAVFTILDDDPVPTVHIGDQAPSWVYEGGDLTWTVSLTNPTYLPVDVSLDPFNVWTTLGLDDYTGTLPTSLHFAPGETVKTFTISTLVDEVQEPAAEAVWIHLTGATNSTLPSVDYVSAADQTDAWGYGSVWDNV